MKVRESSSKKEVLEELLEQGMVLVAFDARIDGVEVPPHLGKDPQLRLNLSFRFGRFLHIEEDAVEAELTFSGVPHLCRVPFAAIFLMVSHVNGDPVLFPDDVPVELLNQASGELRLRESPAPAPSAPSPRPKLSVVADEAESAPASEEEASDEPAQGPQPARKTRKAAAGSRASKVPRKKALTQEVPETGSEKSTNETDTPKTTESRKKKRPAHLRVVK